LRKLDRSDDDDATVITSNTSCASTWTASDSTVTSIASDLTTPRQGLSAIPCAELTDNFYHALALDDKSIAVDSGVSDGFGDEDTPGTDRLDTDYGVTMAGATGDCRTSIATDKFDLPLPPESLNYHVFRRGDLQRPLLSVGKACDAGCRVEFDKDRCQFVKAGQTLLTGYRDRRTGLYLLPTTPKQQAARATLAAHDDVAIRYANHTRALATRPSNTTYGLSAYKAQSVPQLVRVPPCVRRLPQPRHLD
jgi:hypothetical protein